MQPIMRLSPALQEDMKDLLLAFIASQQLLGRSVHSLKAYCRDVTQFLLFLQRENMRIADIQLSIMGLYAAERLEHAQLKNSSMQRELSAIKLFGHYLKTQGYFKHNPIKDFKIKREPRPLPHVMDIDVLSQLLDQPAPQAENEANLWVRDRAMLELLYSSGLRVAELVSINLQDIDFYNLLLRITGKGNKERIVPFGKKALQALKTWLALRQQWCDAQEEAVFISERTGKRLTTRTVERRVKWQAQRAGIDQALYPHLLRHCFASHMLSGSGDLRAVQELLGHANISTTQIYTHLDYEQLSRVYDKAHPRAKK